MIWECITGIRILEKGDSENVKWFCGSKGREAFGRRCAHTAHQDCKWTKDGKTWLWWGLNANKKGALPRKWVWEAHVLRLVSGRKGRRFSTSLLEEGDGRWCSLWAHSWTFRRAEDWQSRRKGMWAQVYVWGHARHLPSTNCESIANSGTATLWILPPRPRFLCDAPVFLYILLFWASWIAYN